MSHPKTRRVGADLAFASYVEPDELGFDELLTARDLMLERLLRARSQRGVTAVLVQAACDGLVVEVEDGDDGGWAA